MLLERLLRRLTRRRKPAPRRPRRRLACESLEPRDLLTVTAFSVAGYPSPVEAGVSNHFVVTAVDQTGEKAGDFTGTASFSSTDPLAHLPADYTFTPGDAGNKTFSGTFKTAGVHTLTVTMLGDPSVTGAQTGIVTEATDVDGFQVAGYPSPTTAGEPHDFTVTAVDRYANPVADYVGTVTFSSSDTNALLPGDYTFTTADAGSRTFNATLRNTGQNRSITATDASDPEIDGRQANIVVEQAHIRYSSGSNIIYVEGGATATLSDIKFITPDAPLELLDAAAKIWKLDADIRVVEGSTLLLHGSDAGGDVDELRLRSDNTADGYVEIRADYGVIDIDSTVITSWDAAAGGPDTEYETFGRAFVRARSRLDDDDATPLESRMNIHNSEISYLGFAGAESYGLSWKVNGDPGRFNELFDQVDVFGDITDSFIHHNYFGLYMFGAFGMNVLRNEVAHNAVYGIDPHDDSDSLLIEGNNSHHNGLHGIICSKRCDGLTIRGNTSSDNNGNGIMLHREGDGNLVEGNTLLRNADSGISLFDSNQNTVRNNTASFNKHGIRLSMGASSNLIESNDFSRNDERGIYLFQGTDPPRLGEDARPSWNLFRDNLVQENGTVGLRVVDADANLFEGNTFSGNGSTDFEFEFSLDNVFRGNVTPAGAELKVLGDQRIASLLFVEDQPGLSIDADAFSDVYLRDGDVNSFTVDSLLDTPDAAPGDGSAADAQGRTTLRAAMQEADALADRAGGPDLIRFNLPGAGPHTIQLTSPLPPVVDSVLLDGTTQPGFRGPAPVVQVDGSNAVGGAAGLTLTAAGAAVRGLAVFGFSGDAIRVEGDDVSLRQNFIGTDAAGSDGLGNGGRGVAVDASGASIGGAARSQGNLIVHNAQAGVLIENGIENSVQHNLIYGNAGTALSLAGGGANDADDADLGPNRLQNHPEIARARLSGFDLTVSYNVPSSVAHAAYDLTIEFYLADAGGQPATYLGQTLYAAASAGGSEQAFFNVKGTSIAVGDRLIASATDAAGNSSPFSVAPIAIDAEAEFPWQATPNAYNVNSDANVNLLDMAALIGFLRNVGAGRLDGTPAPTDTIFPDVNADGSANLLDLANWIGYVRANGQGPAGAPEPEPQSAPLDEPPPTAAVLPPPPLPTLESARSPGAATLHSVPSASPGGAEPAAPAREARRRLNVFDREFAATASSSAVRERVFGDGSDWTTPEVDDDLLSRLGVDRAAGGRLLSPWN